jgi:dipeptidyl aminopeptidase/acylaminoacyl peptidase
MKADGTGARPVDNSLDVRGRPAWSPDGAWIAVAADQGKGPQVYRVPLDPGPPVLTVEEYSIDPVWSRDGSLIVYAGRQVGYDFPIRSVALAGTPPTYRELKLPRGARVRFLPGRDELVVSKGGNQQGNFWLVNPRNGQERPLTAFGRGFDIGEFDVSPDAIVFDRLTNASDIVLITRPRP